MESKRSEATKDRISASLKATREKRMHQEKRVVLLKVNKSTLSASDSDRFGRIFAEAKWVRNSIIALEDAHSYKYDEHKKVVHYDKDKNPITDDVTMPSVYHRGVADAVLRDISNLAKAKAKGIEVGKLHFVKRVDSMDIKTGFIRIKGSEVISIPGFPKLRVYGLGQLKRYGDSYEIADGKLIRKPSGYHVAITVCIDKDDMPKRAKTGKTVGLDFGPSKITTSDGEVFAYYEEETERLRFLERKLSRKKKGSTRHKRCLMQIRVEREKAYNRKMDAAKKVIAGLMERYDTVYFQDEMIASWHASPSYSGRVQHSFVGTVKALLMGMFSGTNGRRAFCIQRGFPTTRLCCTCGEVNSIGRFQKEFHCAYCESEEGDRDVHAAETIRKLGSAIRAQWLDEPCVEGDSSILGGVLEHYRRGQDRLMKRRLSETTAS